MSEIRKPYPNEHSCRLRDPSEFQQDSFRRIKQGKLHIIIGRLKGESTTTAQAYRYPTEDWTESEARSHCKDAGGSFEAAAKAAARIVRLSEAQIDETIAKVREVKAALKKTLRPDEQSTSLSALRKIYRKFWSKGH